MEHKILWKNNFFLIKTDKKNNLIIKRYWKKDTTQ